MSRKRNRRQRKRKVVSVYSIRNFKFLGFALGKGKNVRKVMENVKVYIRGWLGYFGIASMKATMQRWDEWLQCRFRMYIWKQWKNPRTKVRNLMRLGLPEWRACEAVYSGKAYWRTAHHPSVQRAISNKRLAQAGYYSILNRYESLHLCD